MKPKDKEMEEKRTFQQDWSKMNDAQVLNNIKYLHDNYEKCKKIVSIPWAKIVRMDNVKIKYDKKNLSYDVNGKKFVLDGIDNPSKEWFEINALFYFCQDLKAKQHREWWNKNKNSVALITLVSLGIIGVASATVYNNKKIQKEKQQFKQEIIQGVLDGLTKEQSKTVNYTNQIQR